jgi:hypothetical protein
VFVVRAVLQVRHLIEDFWKNIHLTSGYQLLYTPHIAKVGGCMPGCLFSRIHSRC